MFIFQGHVEAGLISADSGREAGCTWTGDQFITKTKRANIFWFKNPESNKMMIRDIKPVNVYSHKAKQTVAAHALHARTFIIDYLSIYILYEATCTLTNRHWTSSRFYSTWRRKTLVRVRERGQRWFHSASTLFSHLKHFHIYFIIFWKINTNRLISCSFDLNIELNMYESHRISSKSTFLLIHRTRFIFTTFYK